MAIGIHDDDIHLVGPPVVAIKAFRQLRQDALKRTCSLSVKTSKTRALTFDGIIDPAELAAQLDCPPGGALLPACCDSRTPVECRGLLVVGVPVGTPEYVAAEALRIAETTAEVLPRRISVMCADHFHEGQLLLRKCALASLMFLSRGVPSALAAPAQRRFDAENVTCMLSLLHAGGSVTAGTATYRQIQLPLSGDMGGLGVTSLEAVGPAAHVASVQTSLALLQRLDKRLVKGFLEPLPAAREEISQMRVPLRAAAASLRFYRSDLAALPVASYTYLRDGEESARSHGGRT